MTCWFRSLLYLWLHFLCFPHEQKPADRSSWTAGCSWRPCTPKGCVISFSCRQNQFSAQTLAQESVSFLYFSPSQRVVKKHLRPAAIKFIDKNQVPRRVVLNLVPRGQNFHGKTLRRIVKKLIQWCHRHSSLVHFGNRHVVTFHSSALSHAAISTDHFGTSNSRQMISYIICIVTLPVFPYKIKSCGFFFKKNRT